jgi:hypothetical protein
MPAETLFVNRDIEPHFHMLSQSLITVMTPVNRRRRDP